MKLTLAEAAPTVAIGLNLCADSPDVTRYINEGIERALACGRFKGTWARYNFLTPGGLLTLPVELETCLTAARIWMPMRIRNDWFEFISSGPGPQTNQGIRGGRYNMSPFNLHDRGDGHVTIRDLKCVSTLRIYCDVIEAADATITIMGYDENGNPVRTQTNGVWQDGETITLNPVSPATFVNSQFHWSGIVQIVKTLTNGNVRLYAVDADSNQSLLGIYGPSTKNPCFRRYETRDMEVPREMFTVCKLRFIKACQPNDVLIIQSEAALKDLAKSVLLSENGAEDQSLALQNKAIDLLNKQLEEHLGDTGGTMDVQMREFSPGTVRAFL